MKHLSDDELVLQYYGESGRRMVDVERHLRSCAQCTRSYDTLARSLNAIAAPTFSERIDARQFVREALRELPLSKRDTAFTAKRWRIVAAEWGVAVLYPTSIRLLFASMHTGGSGTARLVMASLVLAWACAGPIIAAAALDRHASRRLGRTVANRLLAIGALFSATAPALLLLTRIVAARLSPTLGAWPWYGLLAAGAVGALVPWPATIESTRHVVRWHRLTAMGLMVFLLGHVINQALSFVNPSWYVAVRNVLRLASLNPITYTAIVAAVSIQVVTGVVASMKNIGAGSFRKNLQTTTGWYLAAFFLVHVFPGLFVSASGPTAVTVVAATSFNLLANPRGIAQLPFLLLGVATFLFHVGLYARVVALAYLAEASVRRLSYAGALAAVLVIVSVGLSLCGVHL